jgi:hypothetical protein
MNFERPQPLVYSSELSHFRAHSDKNLSPYKAYLNDLNEPAMFTFALDRLFFYGAPTFQAVFNPLLFYTFVNLSKLYSHFYFHKSF